MGNKLFARNRVRLYGWLALMFWGLWMIGDLFNNDQATFFPRAANHFWRTSFLVPINFILFEYTLREIRKRKIIGTIGLLITHAALYSWGLYAWRELGLNLHIYTSYASFHSPARAAEDQLGFSMMSILFFGLSRHFYNHYKLTQAAQQLEIEKQRAELKYLKSQTNPHFLFNTLNNIYSLTRRKSDQAPESVMRLSKILRFMLYETGGQDITIGQEIQVITDYIELEKLRYDKSLEVIFEHKVPDKELRLPPLLLVPLVENAFKHGVSETRDQPYVHIRLEIVDKLLHFEIVNSTDETEKKERVESIGLTNLRRQLEILYTDYKLSIDQQPATFSVVLEINLNSHV